jgi:hypothetical protein
LNAKAKLKILANRECRKKREILKDKPESTVFRANPRPILARNSDCSLLCRLE